MVEANESRFRVETEQLLEVASRCDGPSVPSELEVTDALEQGVARLLFLEAQRLRFLEAQIRGGAVPAADSARGGCPQTDEIVRLRAALTAVRTRTTCERTSCLALGGFVLPARG